MSLHIKLTVKCEIFQCTKEVEWLAELTFDERMLPKFDLTLPKGWLENHPYHDSPVEHLCPEHTKP